MSDNNDVVIIQLDRPRELRFGHKALKRLSAMSGLNIGEIGDSELNMGQVEEIMYYGLLKDARENGEELKMEDMEDLLDYAPTVAYTMEKITEALNKSFSGMSEMEGDVGNVPKPNRQQRRRNGTGNKA
ncbi:hypothetical protein [Paenibacillus pinihumi]|uniref:hypothetical protein n=1 Tax=Paenibacillus pinihumi TaxID=669462 RepID=UPI000565A879|nr:hypothetical protein [Paenibacillus pinihumi]